MAKSKVPAAEKSESPGSKVANVLNFLRPYTDCPTFYSNIGQVSTSANEVRLVLCQAVEPTEDGLTVNPQVVVYLPLDHAKRLADVISQQLLKVGFVPKD